MPGRKPNPKIEISKTKYLENLVNGNCPSYAYGEKKNDNFYDFVDIRLTVNFEIFERPDSEDFTKKDMDIIERQKRYLNSSTKYDNDYNGTMRKYYHFKVMHDLYNVLWNIEDDSMLDSGETIVSPNRAISGWKKELKKPHRGRPSIDWENIEENLKNSTDELEELKRFLECIAYIGNYMPVPSQEQKVIHRYVERFDVMLCDIKKYYIEGGANERLESILFWLDGVVNQKEDKNDGEKLWKSFVDNNYLKGSFVDNDYNIIEFDNTLKQLSNMIYLRSIVMLEAYQKRLESSIDSLQIQGE